MKDIRSYNLEDQAADERERLHSSVLQLRSKLRERLDVRKNAREHLGPLCGAAALVAFTVGYAFTGIFVRS